MKKISTTLRRIIAITFLAITTTVAMAQSSPVFIGSGALANPNPVTFTQPGGTTLTLNLKGDAVVHWATTTDGYTVLQSESGAWEYANTDYSGNLVTTGIKASDPADRSVSETQFLTGISAGKFFSKDQVKEKKEKSILCKGPETAKMGGFPTTGTRKMLMILANFNNTTTGYTQANFNNYMNQANYNSTGSFKDYCYENSYGTLTIVTTVTAWVTVPNAHNTYGPESMWADFVRDACVAADAAGVDFSQFDNNGDGFVDGVAVIHQGVGQEESGSTTDIWSHNYNLSYDGINLTLDGKKVDTYTCQPEKSGSSMASIGVMCHEFGHNLGLPDFYDTDYGTGGQYDGTGYWDVMSSGSYNGSPQGAKPAHHNPWSKIFLGWVSPVTISTAQNITLKNIEQNSSVYKYATTTTNEYFLLENRQLIGFDAGLPGKGMIVYHVDGSYITSHSNANDVVATSHQGMYPKAAGGTINSGSCTFPGTGAKTSFTDATTPNSKSWAGAATNKPLTSIAENTTTKEITFAFMGGGGTTPVAPTVTTNSVSSITSTGAACGGNVTADGGASVTARGVCWSTSASPTVSNSKTADGTGTGAFTSSITGLSAGATYYVRAYATNSAGTGYGSQVSFTATAASSFSIPFTEAFAAAAMPTGWTELVEGTGTTSRWSVSATATAGGAANEMKCTYQQVNPATTRLITPPISTTGYSSLTLTFKHLFDDYGAGATLKIQTSNNKTSWTDAWSLASVSNANIGPATVTVNLTSNLNNATTYVAFMVTGNLYQIDYWYIDNVSITAASGATTPTVTTTAASSITTTGAVSGGNVTAAGSTSVTARGVCWNTSASPTISNSKTVDGSGTGAFASTLTGLSAGTLYYVRAYATNTAGTAYGSQISFTTTASSSTPPTVTTNSISAITSTGATCGGNVTAAGSTSVTARGVCWSTTASPTTANSKTTNGTGTGTFTSSITGLAAGTTYYVRAYATNTGGTSYGSSVSFTTTAATATYCTAKGNNVSYEWIDLVKVNTINNVTAANGGYGNFTSISTNLVRGTAYTIYFSGGFASTIYTEYWRIFIDYNKDGDFADAGEYIVNGSSTAATNYSATFTVPTSATLGSTRMRVIMSDNSGTTSPCGTFTYGEVEDYTINITTAKDEPLENSYNEPANELGSDNLRYLTVYPTPAVDKISVDINNTENVTISIFNIQGKKVKSLTMGSQNKEIDISDLPAGYYTIAVDDGAKVYQGEFIKN